MMHELTLQARRRPAPDTETTTTLEVRPWQMSHVRQYDVIDGYPVHRPWPMHPCMATIDRQPHTT